MAPGMNMRCPKCGVEAAPGKRFCADCGAPLPIRCPKCGAEAEVGKPFCADCGARLEAASLAPAGKPPPPLSGVRVAAESPEIPEGERKTVTALFADIQGSTELIARSRSRGGARAGRPGAAADDGGGASLRRLCRPVDRRRHLRACSARPWRTRTIRSARSMPRSRCSRRFASTQRHTWCGAIP